MTGKATTKVIDHVIEQGYLLQMKNLQMRKETNIQNYKNSYK
jgi:hypothetical protein